MDSLPTSVSSTVLIGLEKQSHTAPLTAGKLFWLCRQSSAIWVNCSTLLSSPKLQEKLYALLKFVRVLLEAQCQGDHEGDIVCAIMKEMVSVSQQNIFSAILHHHLLG